MKAVLRRISLAQTAKILAVMYGMLSFVLLCAYLIGQIRGVTHELIPLGMILLYPLIAALVGMLVALAYNIAAVFVGGIEITLDPADDPDGGQQDGRSTR